MKIDDYRDEYGFTGPLPISSNQRRLPDPGFDPGPEVGEPLPDFSLTDHSGRRVALHADRGDAPAAVVFLRSLVWSPACITQLGELAAAQPAFEAAGIKLYTVSYDDREALAECAALLGVRFPLLADPSSAVIWRFGLLNTLLAPADVPFYGVAHPGTYLLDAKGIVMAKYFHRHMAVRVSPETLIDTAVGRIALEDEPRVRGGADGVRITAFLRGGRGVVRMGLVRHLVIRFELEAGLELCAQTAEGADLPARVEVAGPDGLHVEAPLPVASDASASEEPCWRGAVDLAVPVWASSDLVCIMAPPRHERVALDVTLHYQVSEEGRRRAPRTEVLRLEVPTGASEIPNLPEIGETGHRVVSMESTRHFERLMRRAVREGA